eukprot:Lankesteria_metandrocarpae@DN5350_c0_g1_i11.p1
MSQICNFLHKALGGSRPRPLDVCDGFWKGIHGMTLDIFVRPWVALAERWFDGSGRTSVRSVGITLVVLLRCLICPIYGMLNFASAFTEGFANNLVSEFDQFFRIREGDELRLQRRRSSGGSW